MKGKKGLDIVFGIIAVILLAILVVATVVLCLSLVNGVTFGQQLADWFGAETFFVKWFLK